ncbi:hypothetical protein [uncultured Nitratireductor sp.]|uniref:hypothetical protein n=1 Tax=uncultured Nitratireductor sp. TaxID=520953 RepID=UPI0025DA5FD5|nr:hypothetical protein [uncultured Nitratireductor sp.]
MILPVLLINVFGIYAVSAVALASLKRGRQMRQAGLSSAAARYFCESILLCAMAVTWCAACILAVLP